MLTNQDLKDLLFTLDICEDNLPMSAHPSHRERLERIRQMLRSQAKPQTPAAHDLRPCKTS